jgi:hypothetical protein
MRNNSNILIAVLIAMLMLSCSGKKHNSVIISEKRLTGCITGNCENSFGIFIYPNQDQYHGYWDNGKKSGNGRYIYTDAANDTYRELKTIIADPKYRRSVKYQPQNRPVLIPDQNNCYDYFWMGVAGFVSTVGCLHGGKFYDEKMQREIDYRKRIINAEKISTEKYVRDTDTKIIYRGTWRNDKMHGTGVLEYKNVRISGEWADGKFINNR